MPILCFYLKPVDKWPLSSRVSYNVEILQISYFKTFSFSFQNLCFYSSYSLLPRQNKEWIFYFIPSHSPGHLVCLLNPTLLAPIYLPLGIFKPLVFSFSFKANLSLQGQFFLSLYIPIYSLVKPNSVLWGLAISQPLVTLNVSTNCLVIKTLRKKEKKKE